jgi:hypothetical protein
MVVFKPGVESFSKRRPRNNGKAWPVSVLDTNGKMHRRQIDNLVYPCLALRRRAFALILSPDLFSSCQGVPYITSCFRPMVGEELLALQGIPSDDLLLTKETEDQLKDLAGKYLPGVFPLVWFVVRSCLTSCCHCESSRFLLCSQVTQCRPRLWVPVH